MRRDLTPHCDRCADEQLMYRAHLIYTDKQYLCAVCYLPFATLPAGVAHVVDHQHCASGVP